jgi:hypothetical protein
MIKKLLFLFILFLIIGLIFLFLFFVPETKEITSSSQSYYPSNLYYEDTDLNLIKVNKIKIIFDTAGTNNATNATDVTDATELTNISSIKKYIDSKVYIQALNIFKKKRKFKIVTIDEEVSLSSVAKYILRKIRKSNNHFNVSGVKLYSGNIEAQVLIT